MKHRLRCLSRVSNHSHYFLLGSYSSSPRGPTKSHRSSPKLMKVGCSGQVPEGHLPVYVGEEKERFVVRTKLLNHPMFLELLNQSANEYGYERQGVLRIPAEFLFSSRSWRPRDINYHSFPISSITSWLPFILCASPEKEIDAEC